MKSEKEKLLKETYDKFIQISLSDFPIKGIEEFVDQQIMGYGTTVDEKVLNIDGYRELVNRQREQGKGIKMTFETTPVVHRIVNDEKLALFVDEILFSIHIEPNPIELFLRISTVLEYRKEKWVVVHWHGSKPEYEEGGKDTWHIDEQIAKTKKLEKEVAEKTADLEIKNRELEIETALEKVRSSALAMKKPEDMLEVCKIISKQLQTFGIDNIRNVQTVIINDEKGTYLNYQYFAAYEKSVIEETEYDKHPTVLAMVREMRISANAFFSGSFERKALNTFREYRKQDNQFPDPLLDETNSIHYNFYSIGQGGLGVTTYSELPEAGLEIFKRFHNVFRLAYRRFIDIEQAEAQAREAQIEVALERARTQSMLMQHSDELIRTSQVFHEQLQILGMDSEFSYLWLPDEKKAEHLFWATWQDDQKHSTSFNNRQVTYPLDKTEPSIAACFVAWESGDVVHINYVAPTEVEDYFATWTELLHGIEKFNPELFAEGLYYVDAYMKYGCFGIVTRKLLTENEQQVLSRFTKEFERAYTRFLGLQTAEAQAREAQIELALERIRAQAMAMKESSDLLDIVVTMRSEFVALEHEAHYFWHMRWLPDTYEKAMTSGDGSRIGMVMELPRGFHENAAMLEWEQNTEPVIVIAFDVDGAIDYVDKMIRMGRFSEIDHNAPGPDDLRAMGGLTFVMARTTHGEIGYSLPGVVPNPPVEDLATLIRFAGVFDLAYRRFEDLKEAEAQTREAQIEVALERVRSEAMAMQKSDDLSIAVKTIFDELDKLDIGMLRCGIGILNKENRSAELWTTTITDGNNTVQVSGDESMDIHPLLKGAFEAWLNKTDFSYVLEGKDLNNYYKSLLGVNFKLPESQSKTSKIKGLKQYYFVATFQAGGLFAFRETEFPDESKIVIKRFADVFNLTYTRFQDLQFAEAQAREAKIEAALERVRSKALAMHNSDDLALTVDVFFKELKNLKVTPHRCGVTLINEETRVADLTVTTANNQGDDLKISAQLKLAGHPVLDKIYDSWKVQEEYHPVLHGKEIKKYYQVMNPQVRYPDFTDDVIQYGHYFFFEEGGVFAWTDNELSEKDLQIFRRYTSVLSLTYRRYMDLKEAEAQNKIIQAENERKTQELEEARELQLAMLPKEIPQLSNLDITVYMKTATEVGGDYYDFSTKDDGSLNICLGDATGHGMKAGIMVSSMKSIFTTNAPKMDIKAFFSTANNGVKSMQLKRMMMGFTMLNINKNSFNLVNAGMPPVYLFRKKTNSVEELKEHGLPIGAMNLSTYKTTNGLLDKGDVLLLMSDGMPELQNDQNEMYGYDRIRDALKTVAEKKAEEIVSNLKDEGSAWINDQDPDDDVTFVVIKAK